LTAKSAAVEAPRDGGRLAGLDGLRGVAVLLVVAYHYTVRWVPPIARETVYPYGGVFVRRFGLEYAWSGVELFFVVSGFVILMSLEKSASILDFGRRRLARLWPAMLVCSALTMLIAPLGPPRWRVGLVSWLTSVFFIDPDVAGGLLNRRDLAWVDGVYWTLWIEVRFYVMAALVFWLFRWRVLEVFCVLAGLSLVAGLHNLPYPGRDWAWWLLLPSYLPYFVYGAACWRLAQERLRRRSTLVVLLASGAMVLIGGFVTLELPAGDPLIFALVNVAILLAPLLLAVDAPLARGLAAPPLARLGEASYSLYLIHSVVGVTLICLLARIIPWPLALGAVTAGMVGLAFLLHRYVELPGKALMLALWRPRAPARPAGPSPAALSRIPYGSGERLSPSSTIVNG
jgi:peptidoglycan/LPS O-acetylase OafA/YrhL